MREERAMGTRGEMGEGDNWGYGITGIEIRSGI